MPDKSRQISISDLGLTNVGGTFVIDGVRIKRRNDIDLFGINIDATLSFERHTTNICGKVMRFS